MEFWKVHLMSLQETQTCPCRKWVEFRLLYSWNLRLAIQRKPTRCLPELLKSSTQLLQRLNGAEQNPLKSQHVSVWRTWRQWGRNEFTDTSDVTSGYFCRSMEQSQCDDCRAHRLIHSGSDCKPLSCSQLRSKIFWMEAFSPLPGNL